MLLAGCKADATVAIVVHDDGRGTVTVSVALDRDARAALAGPGAMPAVPLSDLRRAGWTVSSWRATSGGGAALRLEKGFTGSAGLAAVLAELDGRAGALRDAKVTRERSLARDRDAVSLLADLRDLHAGVSDDAALATRLRAAGVDVAALDANLASRIGDAFTLTVRLQLPDGTATVAHVAPGTQQRVSIESATEHSGRIGLLVVAAGLAVIGVAGLAFASVQAARARRRRAGRG